MKTNALKRIRSYFPSYLPTTPEDFDSFATDVLETYGMDVCDQYKESIATMIMHMTQVRHWSTKRWFYIGLKKTLANSASYTYVQRLRKKMNEDAQAAAANKLEEKSSN